MQTREKTTQIKIKENNKEEERTMRNKKGISLIVLVITIIVMIILAAAVIISLSNSGVINRANQAVNATNLAEVQHLASLAWSEAYLENMSNKNLTEEQRAANIKAAVEKVFTDNNLNAADYNLTYGAGGVTVAMKETTTLGSLITNPKEDYGKKVNYSVKVGDDTYSNWRILYHNEDYVYLILDGKLPTDVLLDKGTTVASLTSGETNYLELYEKFRVGDAAKYKLEDTVNGNTSRNSQAVAQLIVDYANFGDTTESYKEYVVGAIGGPTIELLAAGWNAKIGTPTMTVTTDTYGYKINNEYGVLVTSDGLYVPSDYWYWLASPSAGNFSSVMGAGSGNVALSDYHSTLGVRPVVCLKSNIPATAVTGDYDFSLTK